MVSTASVFFAVGSASMFAIFSASVLGLTNFYHAGALGDSQLFVTPFGGPPKSEAIDSQFEVSASYVPAWSVKAVDPNGEFANTITMDAVDVHRVIEFEGNVWAIDIKVLVLNQNFHTAKQLGTQNYIELVRAMFPEEKEVHDALTEAKATRRANLEFQNEHKAKFRSMKHMLT